MSNSKEKLLFTSLVECISEFTPDKPLIVEYVLEEELRRFLEARGFTVSRQVTKKKDRYDLLCRSGNQLVCLELKQRADISDVSQFDRYLPKFKDGLIVICWQASRSVRDIFSNVIEQSPIPLALIELSKKYGLA